MDMSTSILKDTFYREKLIHLSVTSGDIDETKNEERKKLKELSRNALTLDLIEEGLSHFGKTADGISYGFLAINLSGMSLYSILGLEDYQYIQHVELSNNNLMTLKPLSALRFLTYLDVSNNKLTKLFDFKPPDNLEVADYSFNEIEEIPDLSKHRFLTKLVLNNNKIKKIDGLSQNKNLTDLRLNNNYIEDIENLDDLALTQLHIQGNNIRLISGLFKLPKLRTLNLSRNLIIKLNGLVDLMSLRNLYLSDNNIKNVKELYYVESLPYLSVLDLCFNSIQERKFYRLQVLYRLPNLRILDGVNVIPEEIVKAENLYGLDLEDRRKIFNEILSEEEFVDRRINTAEFIDPETDSDNENIHFIDQYDPEGKLIQQKGSTSQNKFFSKNSQGSLSMNGSVGGRNTAGLESSKRLNGSQGTDYEEY